MKRSDYFQVFTKYIIVILLMFASNMGIAQYINVSTSYTADQLVKDIFIGSTNASCITVDNVTVTGWDFGGGDLSYGYFNRNGSVFEMDEGIILSSGRVSEAVGSFPGIQSASASGWGGDSDLERGANISSTTNATILEFDFTSNQSDKISFDYMFLSEQYLRQFDPGTCGYTDGFAFLIKKVGDPDYQNIAVIPGSQTSITSNNVRGAGGKCSPINENYFGHYNPDYSPVSFNGQTAILTAKTEVVPGQKYHIKLVIADQGNGLYDSGVFLKAGSFTGNIDIGTDLTINNADPICENVPYRIQPNPAINDTSAQYSWFKNGQVLNVPTNQSYYDVVNEEGAFSVSITLGSGCKLEGNVIIEKAPVAQVSTVPMMVCDDDFNGSYSAKLSKFDYEIIRDYEPSVFTRSYSLTPNGPSIDPDSQFVFTSNPQTLYLSVGAFTCTPDVYPIQFYFGTQLTFNTVQEVDVCDDDISGDQTFNLADYISLITNESDITATYFDTEAKAKFGGNSTIPSSQTINADQSFFIRIEKAGFCPNFKEIKFKFKQPKKSLLIKDEVICKGTTIDLDAGAGFQFYEWSNGVKGQFANEIKKVSPGDYWVKLTFNDCVYQQFFKISEAEEPVIENVLIEGTTVTVLVSGGTLPYTFALDNGTYQSSNVFTNVELGTHIIYVKGSDGCAVIAKEFTLINSQNYITPNNDGVNDVINYSSLLQKSEPKFEIYDRFGIQVFKGDANNRFIWNGTSNGRSLPTASYWYILEWNESGNPKRTQLSGWILLKNRN